MQVGAKERVLSELVVNGGVLFDKLTIEDWNEAFTDVDGEIMSPLITWEEFMTRVELYEKENEAEQYKFDRIYPSWEEQADMQYWDTINGTTTWIDTISSIKDKYPKL